MATSKCTCTLLCPSVGWLGDNPRGCPWADSGAVHPAEGFDPRLLLPADSKGLSNPAEVEALREKVYASLEAYCKHKYPEQPGR